MAKKKRPFNRRHSKHSVTRRERVICMWCGTDRRYRKACSRGAFCYVEAANQGREVTFLDLDSGKKVA